MKKKSEGSSVRRKVERGEGREERDRAAGRRRKGKRRGEENRRRGRNGGGEREQWGEGERGRGSNGERRGRGEGGEGVQRPWPDTSRYLISVSCTWMLSNASNISAFFYVHISTDGKPRGIR